MSNAKEKRKCPICGNELDEGEDICPRCGSLVDEPCYDIESDMEDDDE